MAHDGSQLRLGQPYVAGMAVTCEVLEHRLGPKEISYHFRRRENWRKTVGHRQQLTRLLVKAIEQAQAGERPLMVLDRAAASGMTGPATMDAIGPTDGWESFWPEIDRQRRDAAPWKRSAA